MTSWIDINQIMTIIIWGIFLIALGLPILKIVRRRKSWSQLPSPAPDAASSVTNIEFQKSGLPNWLAQILIAVWPVEITFAGALALLVSPTITYNINATPNEIVAIRIFSIFAGIIAYMLGWAITRGESFPVGGYGIGGILLRFTIGIYYMIIAFVNRSFLLPGICRVAGINTLWIPSVVDDWKY